MMDEPERSEPPANAETLEPAAPAAPPERDPFWGYMDLLIFAGLAIPCMLAGFGVVKAALWALRLHSSTSTWELLAQQFAGYGFLFGALAGLFRTQYDRPRAVKRRACD